MLWPRAGAGKLLYGLPLSVLTLTLVVLAH